MHPPAVREQAMRLIAAGINDCEISRRMGIPRGTIRDWRRPTNVPRKPAIPRETCPRCWRSAKPLRFTAEDYCELLGLYLGDGCVSAGARTMRLRIAMDAKYPRIIEEGRQLLEMLPLQRSGCPARSRLSPRLSLRLLAAPAVPVSPTRARQEA
jgi:hypothetical protein